MEKYHLRERVKVFSYLYKHSPRTFNRLFSESEPCELRALQVYTPESTTLTCCRINDPFLAMTTRSPVTRFTPARVHVIVGDGKPVASQLMTTVLLVSALIVSPIVDITGVA